MKTHRKNLLELYAQIPEMTCHPSCRADCCGIVPWAKIEWEPIRNKRPGIGIDCPYVGKDWRCEIYEDRPFMCRIFGVADTELLRCPHGCKPSVPLSQDQARDLTQQYIELREETET